MGPHEGLLGNGGRKLPRSAFSDSSSAEADPGFVPVPAPESDDEQPSVSTAEKKQGLKAVEKAAQDDRKKAKEPTAMKSKPGKVIGSVKDKKAFLVAELEEAKRLVDEEAKSVS